MTLYPPSSVALADLAIRAADAERHPGALTMFQKDCLLNHMAPVVKPLCQDSLKNQKDSAAGGLHW